MSDREPYGEGVESVELPGFVVRYVMGEGLSYRCECGFVTMAAVSDEGSYALVATSRMARHLVSCDRADIAASALRGVSAMLEHAADMVDEGCDESEIVARRAELRGGD